MVNVLELVRNEQSFQIPRQIILVSDWSISTDRGISLVEPNITQFERGDLKADILEKDRCASGVPILGGTLIIEKDPYNREGSQ